MSVRFRGGGRVWRHILVDTGGGSPRRYHHTGDEGSGNKMHEVTSPYPLSHARGSAARGNLPAACPAGGARWTVPRGRRSCRGDTGASPTLVGLGLSVGGWSLPQPHPPSVNATWIFSQRASFDVAVSEHRTGGRGRESVEGPPDLHDGALRSSAVQRVAVGLLDSQNGCPPARLEFSPFVIRSGRLCWKVAASQAFVGRCSGFASDGLFVPWTAPECPLFCICVESGEKNSRRRAFRPLSPQMRPESLS